MTAMCEVSHECMSCGHTQALRFRDQGGGVTILGNWRHPHECVRPTSRALYAYEAYVERWRRYSSGSPT